MSSAITENVELAKLLGSLGTTLFGSPKSNTTKTETTSGTRSQVLVNPADILRLLSEEPGTGVASTLAQGASAGVRSPRKGLGSNALVLNDLLSRIGTKAAVAGAPTVTSPTTIASSGTQQTKGIVGGSGLGLLGTAGALVLASPSARKFLKEGAQDIFGKDIFDFLKKKQPDVTAAGGEAPLVGDFPTAGGPLQTGTSLVSYDGGLGYDLAASTGFSEDALSSYIDATSRASDVAGSIGDGFSAYDYFGSADTATSAIDGIDSFVNSQFDSAVADASGGIDGATGGAFGGVPVLGIANALSDGKVTSKEVGGLGGAYAGAQIGTAIFPGVGTVIGGLVGSIAGDSLCFITTAILKAHGSEDHQHPMLQVLRRYRDTWLKENHPEDIATYYEIAPKIVDAVNLCTDSEQVWKNLYAGFLVPAIHCIEHGDNAGAYELYRNMVIAAKEYAYG